MPAELSRCGELVGYCELVRRVSSNCERMDMPDAVDAAVASYIDDGILSSYLRSRRAEVKDMFMTEYDEEQVRRWAREEGREEERVSNIKNLMDSMNVDVEEAMNVLKAPDAEREKYRAQFC